MCIFTYEKPIKCPHTPEGESCNVKIYHVENQEFLEQNNARLYAEAKVAGGMNNKVTKASASAMSNYEKMS